MRIENALCAATIVEGMRKANACCMAMCMRMLHGASSQRVDAARGAGVASSSLIDVPLSSLIDGLVSSLMDGPVSSLIAGSADGSRRWPRAAATSGLCFVHCVSTTSACACA